MKMRKIQQGFTLIELMIVVAIIGILSSIALPAFKAYSMKAAYTEVIQATSAAKLAIELCVLYQTLANCSTLPVQAGWSAGFQVHSITLGGQAGGPYTITVTPEAINDIRAIDDYILTGTLIANTSAVTWTTSGGCKTRQLC